MEQAIRKAIEGEYRYKGHTFESFQGDMVCFVNMDMRPQIWLVSYNDILLDPLFWQALGKAEGWEEVQLSSSVFREDTIDGNTEKEVRTSYVRKWQADRAWERDWHIDGWKYQMFRFTEHLMNGKSPDSFFKDLLSLSKEN